MNKLIKCLGTAFVGSFFLVRGIAFYAGNYPGDMTDMPKDMQSTASKAMWAYLAVLVLNTIIGTSVQLYVFRETKADASDDFMRAEDEGRTCGCF
jgi:hypothetical protein